MLLHDSHGLWPLFLEKLFAGQDVALVNYLVAADEIEAGRLRKVFDCTISGEMKFIIVTPKKTAKAPDVRKNARLAPLEKRDKIDRQLAPVQILSNPPPRMR